MKLINPDQLRREEEEQKIMASQVRPISPSLLSWHDLPSYPYLAVSKAPDGCVLAQCKKDFVALLYI